ncbi:UDP-glucose 4-epimerase [mine drainage metagenome]|uniref:UDP-glucose 4-epimerase n=1 Tax=mine drainage metagenome TaxID=410659 RepID=A0A1J5PVL6_9ZZZZ
MILVTGGTGYIGSHTVIELMASGYDVFIIDNHSNSKISVLDRIERVVGRRPGFARIDIRNREEMRSLFNCHQFKAVMHFAGLKAVGESVGNPLQYYDNNVAGSLVLFESMAEADVRQLVFSSSATVYGDPHAVPIRENFPLSATNPYGRSKLMIEDILRDLEKSDPRWHIALLRYFNPVGAHASGLIGEDPNGIPNNLMPYLTQVAAGKLKELSIFGNDYATPDGTGIRDYIHVVDLALGHIAALNVLASLPNMLTLNLGTGRGCSVLELIRSFAKASGHAVPYKIVQRRPGDIAQCYADPDLALDAIGWQATRNIEQMCADAWRWQENAHLQDPPLPH